MLKSHERRLVERQTNRILTLMKQPENFELIKDQLLTVSGAEGFARGAQMDAAVDLLNQAAVAVALAMREIGDISDDLIPHSVLTMLKQPEKMRRALNNLNISITPTTAVRSN